MGIGWIAETLGRPVLPTGYRLLMPVRRPEGAGVDPELRVRHGLSTPSQALNRAPARVAICMADSGCVRHQVTASTRSSQRVAELPSPQQGARQLSL